jgi:hypothetical protein
VTGATNQSVGISQIFRKEIRVESGRLQLRRSVMTVRSSYDELTYPQSSFLVAFVTTGISFVMSVWTTRLSLDGF